MSNFYVKERGALGDGRTDCTDIVQSCIDQCSRMGGGKVILEGGTYVCGTLYLKSKVTLEIAESAVLSASQEIQSYGINTHHNRYRNETSLDRCFLYAEGQENISITGHGVILGNAEAFPNEGSGYRPMLMRFLNCQNVRLTDIRLYDAASWTAAFLDSRWLYVNRVEICNEKRYNGDGLDFDGCAHVFVSDCCLKGTDDNLCLQSSSKKNPAEDIHITNCEFTSICAAIRIGLKSIGSIRNVVIANCSMHNVWREGIKIECTEGGNITDILVNNVTMCNVSRPLFLILNNRFAPEGLGSSLELEEMPEIGTMERLVFSNIIAVDEEEEMSEPHLRFKKDLMGAPWFNGIRMDASREHKICDVTMENIQYMTVGGVKQDQIPDHYPEVLDLKSCSGQEVSENYYPDWSRAAYMDARNIKNLYLSNVRFSSLKRDERPEYLLDGCSLLKNEIYII